MEALYNFEPYIVQELGNLVIILSALTISVGSFRQYGF